MNEEKNKLGANLYRDFLIPVSIFISVNTAIILFILTIPTLTSLLIASVSCLILSNLTFIFSFFESVTEIEAIETDAYENSISTGIPIFCVVLAVLFFLIGFSLLAFWKTIILGLISSILSFIMIILFVIRIRYIEKKGG